MIDPGTPAAWRDWLTANAEDEREVWLVLRPASLPYAEAVEQALCFGWIDGQHRKRDAESSVLRFTPRRPGSAWSKLNRERAERLAATGRMTPAGQAVVDQAKASGAWDRGAVVPDDLRALLDANPAARDHFATFPPSSVHLILDWIATAKRPETRAKRLARTVELAERGLRANHPNT